MPTSDADAVADVLLAAERPLLVVHRHADLDAVGSAAGLAALLDAPATLVAPDGVASRAQPLAAEYGLFDEWDLADHDAVVVLDAPSQERIAPCAPRPDEQALVVVDHHEPDDLRDEATAALVDTDAGATAELVYRVADAGEWELTPGAAYPLAAGLLDDTGFLKSAAPPAYAAAGALLSAVGERAGDLPGLLERERSRSERRAATKGMVRARVYAGREFTLAITRIGGHETATAHGLLSCGVDAAVVCSEQSERVRVVARRVDRRADDLSVPDLFDALVERFGGDGGGHGGAGVAHLETTDVDAVGDAVPRAVEDQLGWALSELTG